MKKFLLIAVLALAASPVLCAQDVITTVKGEQIKAKVTEVAPDSVKYKRIDNPNGPVYVMPTAEILSILYENGSKDVYGEPVAEGHKDAELIGSVEAEPFVPEDARPVEFADGRQAPAPRREEPRADFGYKPRYKDIAPYYDSSYYVSRAGDPYVPVLSGLASWFIPGLGQFLDDEPGRGLGIIGANIGLVVLETVESSLIFYSAAEASSYYMKYGHSYGSDGLAAASLGALILTGAFHVGFNIWNIVDAVKVAEVKNMYYQDTRGRRASWDMHLQPNLAFAPAASGSVEPVAGLSLSLSF